MAQRRRSLSVNVPMVVTPPGRSSDWGTGAPDIPGTWFTAEPEQLADFPNLSRRPNTPINFHGGASPGVGYTSDDSAGSGNSNAARTVFSPGPESPSARHMRKMSYSKERVYEDTGPWCSGDKFRFPLSNPEEGAWEIIHKLGKDYDKGMCAAWRDEIEKVIIFAGLFAATVVAFLVVSYLMLKPDPQDYQNELLRHIASQLDTSLFALSHPTPSTAQPIPLPPPPKSFHPTNSAIRMNATLFLSMTIALSTVLLGTTCLQWIREYDRDTRLGPKEAAALRYMRLEGLIFWRVPLIISSLPILLQIAVGLFFWGLCEFLSVLNSTVTIINIAALGIVAFIVVATFSLPAFQSIFVTKNGLRGHQVPFKSPQARLFARIAFWWARASIWALLLRYPKSEYLKTKRTFIKKLSQTHDWVSYDTAWQAERLEHLGGISAQESKDVPLAIAWVAQTHIYSQVAIAGVYRALREVYPSTSMQVLRRLIDASSPGAHPHLDAFTLKWGKRHDDVLSDVKAALVLDQFVKNNPQLAAPLLHIRVELFVRIVNHNAHDPPSGGNGTTATTLDVWTLFEGASKEWDLTLLIPFEKGQDYSLIPDVFKVQLIRTFKAYLRTQKYHDILWNIVLELVVQTVTSGDAGSMPLDLAQELNSFNEELRRYVMCIGGHLSPLGRTFGNLLDDYVRRVNEADVECLKLRNREEFLNQLGVLQVQLHPRPTLAPPHQSGKH